VAGAFVGIGAAPDADASTMGEGRGPLFSIGSRGATGTGGAEVGVAVAGGAGIDGWTGAARSAATGGGAIWPGRLSVAWLGRGPAGVPGRGAP
jgi:hypothetical protein